MKLSNEAITSFQKLYQDKIGVLLSLEEAEQQAIHNLELFALLYRPIHKNYDTGSDKDNTKQ